MKNQVRDDVKPERPPFNPYCYANGCPKYGSVSESTLGGGPWLCIDHFKEKERSHWDKITQQLRQRVAK